MTTKLMEMLKKKTESGTLIWREYNMPPPLPSSGLVQADVASNTVSISNFYGGIASLKVTAPGGVTLPIDVSDTDINELRQAILDRLMASFTHSLELA
jgi:hypothetical protein